MLGETMLMNTQQFAIVCEPLETIFALRSVYECWTNVESVLRSATRFHCDRLVFAGQFRGPDSLR